MSKPVTNVQDTKPSNNSWLSKFPQLWLICHARLSEDNYYNFLQMKKKRNSTCGSRVARLVYESVLLFQPKTSTSQN
jgi:hypothetical protein